MARFRSQLLTYDTGALLASLRKAVVTTSSGSIRVLLDDHGMSRRRAVDRFSRRLVSRVLLCSAGAGRPLVIWVDRLDDRELTGKALARISITVDTPLGKAHRMRNRVGQDRFHDQHQKMFPRKHYFS